MLLVCFSHRLAKLLLKAQKTALGLGEPYQL